MKKIKTFKVPFQTNLFNKGQKVFVIQVSGNQSIKVRGKYRGKHRYISGWIQFNDCNCRSVDIREIQLSERDYSIITNNNLNTHK